MPVGKLNKTMTIRYGDMVSDAIRWALFIYATKIKGVKYKELGITPAMGNMIKNHKRRVADDLLDKLLEKLTAKDLIQLTLLLKQWNTGSKPEWARRLAWLGRRPDEAEVRGSNPRGPTFLDRLCLISHC